MCRSHRLHRHPQATAVHHPDSALDRLVAALRDAGCLVTAQRRAILEALCESEGHICAEHILDRVRQINPLMRVNKTTVYRSLDLLASLGEIKRVSALDGRAQYELAGRGGHNHLVCTRCGNLQEMDNGVAASLSAAIKSTSGFVPSLDHNPIFGLCRACAN